MPEIITDTPDSPNFPMEFRLQLQALKNKRYLDKTLNFEFYERIDKRDLLEMLLKSSQLMAIGAEHIEKQQGTITRLQMNEINRAFGKE